MFRNLEDFVSDNVTNTLDKPKEGFQVQPEKMFGGVDIKINSQGNRLAVSSIDYGMTIYNIDGEKGLTHYKDTHREQIDASKIEFTPSGNEILSGQLSLKIFDITQGAVVSEFGRGQKAVSSIAFVKYSFLIF